MFCASNNPLHFVYTGYIQNMVEISIWGRKTVHHSFYFQTLSLLPSSHHNYQLRHPSSSPLFSPFVFRFAICLPAEVSKTFPSTVSDKCDPGNQTKLLSLHSIHLVPLKTYCLTVAKAPPVHYLNLNRTLSITAQSISVASPHDLLKSSATISVDTNWCGAYCTNLTSQCTVPE